ncbi:piggyBac transposable element-derived protein 4-like [Stegodyphus dumicola]|uniref:piggyBac transposable element-derived protein 4-like n=1 Tax=Stegodyphus dumicola TaxID=202533 RepID=UPI0015B2FFE6|nr:piggyBac transposable element-derived protein 4-like [Stegodyphus dumicola]
MSMKRFKFLLSNLRFDNPDDKEERKKSDPAALISEVMNLFIYNSQKAYTLGTCVCIDEMLVGFRGKCRFKMYMPQKPVKYGLKVMCLTDARNNYAYNAYLYCGKDSDGISVEERVGKNSANQVKLFCV